jgi:hypothetical protein
MPKQCLNCGYLNEDDVERCLNCGYSMFKAQINYNSPERKILTIVIITLASLILLSFLLSYIYPFINSPSLSLIITAKEVQELIGGNWIILVNQTGLFQLYQNGTSKINLLNGSVIYSLYVARQLTLFQGMILSTGKGYVETLSQNSSQLVLITFISDNSSYYNSLKSQFDIMYYIGYIQKINNFTYYDPRSNSIVLIKNDSLILISSQKLDFKTLYQLLMYVQSKLKTIRV